MMRRDAKKALGIVAIGALALWAIGESNLGASVSPWKTYATHDAMTDESGMSTRYRNRLGVDCFNGRLSVWITWPDDVITRGAMRESAVTYRIGSAPPVASVTAVASDDTTLHLGFGDNARTLAQNMANASPDDSALFRTLAPGGGSQDVSIPLNGFRDEVSPTLARCGVPLS